MNEPCDCCDGITQLTPVVIANRPGLNALVYRAGTHGAFLATMKARLSNFYLDIQKAGRDEHDQSQFERIYPLRGLTTRADDDPAIALLDAWAIVADVLTFYQERIANEGYLRTATERRSILEIARLVGYTLRPGVAATVYLAYTLDSNFKDEVIIPAGARAQSLPGPGELPQSFETSEPLAARAGWNVLKPRMTRPQTEATVRNGDSPRVYLKGTSTNLKPNDPLLIDFGTQTVFTRVQEIQPDTAANRTLVTLQSWPDTTKTKAPKHSPEAVTAATKRELSATIARYLGEEADKFSLSRDTKMFKTVSEHLAALQEYLAEDVPFPPMIAHIHGETLPKLDAERQIAEQQRYRSLQPWLKDLLAEIDQVATRASALHAELLARADMRSDAEDGGAGKQFADVLTGLVKPVSIPPANALQLKRNVAVAFQPKADTGLQIIGAFQADLRTSLPVALANMKANPAVQIRVYALRVKAPPFGNIALPKPIRNDQGIIQDYEEWPLTGIEEFKVHLLPEGPSLQALISLKRGSETFSAQAPLNRDSKQVTTVPLDGLEVVITSTPATTTTSLTFNFEIEKLKRAITISSRAEQIIDVVATHGGVVISTPISVGDHLRRVIGDRKVEIANRVGGQPSLSVSDESPLPPNPLNVIALNAKYEQIIPGSWAVIERPRVDNPELREQLIRTIEDTRTISKADYSITGEVTQLTLDEYWLYNTDRSLAVVRGTTVYTQSEELPLAEAPIDDSICGSSNATKPNAVIELDGVYSELQAGRWLIVSGERTDIRVRDPDHAGQTVPVTGVNSSELVMLAEVVQRVWEPEQSQGTRIQRPKVKVPPVPGEKIHTFIRLAQQLEYCYKRDTVTIYGNVVKATHGETRNQVLGSGDGSQALQSFALKQPPLTFVAASNPRGVDSTLLVRVNDIEWHQSDTLADLQPTDRKFITRTDDDDITTVIFGNGWQGARLPTGIENIKAVYRNGIGKPGNVQAAQISLLATRPLGVKEVINPLRASGGADRESRDQARKNAPLAVLALDRLVSTQDYEDFARVFAGIGKANAALLTDGRRQLVFVTIAGAEDIPIDKSSDLYRNLVKALRQFGDPHQPLQVELRELLLIVISANVRLRSDYLWEPVVRTIRTRLLDTFSFDRRELAQDVVLSEVISVIQAVDGVAYVDVDLLGAVPEKKSDNGKRRLLIPDEIALEIQKQIDDSQAKGPRQRITVNAAGAETNPISPAQLAFLTPDVPATLILNQIT